MIQQFTPIKKITVTIIRANNTNHTNSITQTNKRPYNIFF